MNQLALAYERRPSHLERAFAEFHRANPEVGELFKRFTLATIAAGHRHSRPAAILHRIRWHVAIETKSRDGLKINSNHAAYYSRLWEREHPEHAGFFRKRAVRK